VRPSAFEVFRISASSASETRKFTSLVFGWLLPDLRVSLNRPARAEELARMFVARFRVMPY
jgi:hypothetical protein